MSRPTAETDHRGIDVAGPAEAQPIVFVHGVTFTRKMWVPQRDALSDEYRVVAPDLPGHGARGGEEFDFERALAVLNDVVESLAGGRATVVGLSLGGYVSTAFAHRHPEKVDSLVVSGSSANPVGLLGVLTRLVSMASQFLTRIPGAKSVLGRLAEQWVRGQDLPADVEQEITDSGFYPAEFGRAGLQLAGNDFRSAFASFPGPALVLNGRWDLLNRASERAHVAAATDARAEVVEGAGHVCNLERPATFVDSVRRFVESSGRR